MSNKPENRERASDVDVDTPVKWSEDDVARQEQGLPKHPGKELPVGKEVPGSNHEGYAEAETL